MTPAQVASYKAACAEYDQPRPVRTAADLIPAGLVFSVAENFPIEQLEGRECVLCEQPIVPGETLRPIWMDSHFDLYAHERCSEEPPPCPVEEVIF